MRQEILGVGFDPVTGDQAAAWALERLERREAGYICTPNPEMIMLARKDPALLRAVNGADMVLADGVGVLWASRRLGKPLPERVAGYDFLMTLLEKMTGSVFLLGGKPGVAEKAAETIRARFPGVTVAGAMDGYFTDEGPVLEAIGAARPDLLLVCLGMPKQELWMAAHRDCGACLMAGLGGSLDVLAGTVKRAPAFWRERGLEWLYRLLRQPRRIKRQIRLPLYAAAVLARRKDP